MIVSKIRNEFWVEAKQLVMCKIIELKISGFITDANSGRGSNGVP